MKLVVVGPSDTADEVARVPAALDELNNSVANNFGVYLDWKHWKKDVFPGLHWFGVQGLIDEVLRIENCDVLVVVFKNRFGTPMRSGKTGTEHEWLEGFEAWKKTGRPAVMTFLSNAKIASTDNKLLRQRQKVNSFFQRHVWPHGLPSEYTTPDDFERELRIKLAAWLQHRAKAAQADFFERYRAQLSAFRERWDLSMTSVTARDEKGRPIEAHLDQMYQALRLGKEYDAAKLQEGRVWESAELLREGLRLMIQGPGGSGKTTWLRYNFLELLKNPAAFPLFIELRDLHKKGFENKSITDYLRDWLTSFSCPNSDLEAVFRDGQSPIPVLFVDGWDELGESGKDVRDHLIGLLRDFQRVRAVVTSRPYGTSIPSGSDGFETVSVQPLADEEIQRFAETFFGVCHGRDEQQSKEGREEFWRRLEASPKALALARSPLLLTMMFLLSRAKPLPDKRHELYAACVENLLHDLPQRRMEAGVALPQNCWAPDDFSVRLRAVRELAFALQDAYYSQEYAEEQVIASRKEMEDALPADWDYNRRRFLNWLAGPAGLLTDRVDDTFSFVHLSFQEYLAALHLKEETEGEERVRVCLERMERPMWRETLRLWAALVWDAKPKNLEPVLNNLLESVSGRNLAGAMLADGAGSLDIVGRWASQFGVDIRINAGSPLVCAGDWASAGRSSPDRRKRALQTIKEAAGKSNWLEWFRCEIWVGAAGLRSELALPESAIDRVCVESSMHLPKTWAHVALGRVWNLMFSAWPKEPWQLHLLNVWPGRRRGLGLKLQIESSLGAQGPELQKEIRAALEKAQADENWNVPEGYYRWFHPRGSWDAINPASAFFTFLPHKLWPFEEPSARSMTSAAISQIASTKSDIPEVKLLSEACKCWFKPDRQRTDLQLACERYSGDPLWPALARWTARIDAHHEEDRLLLETRVRNAENDQPPLSWGLQFIARGDVLLADGQIRTLDSMAEEAGLAPLPYVEDMPVPTKAAAG